MTRFYTGIGSRETPEPILDDMRRIAKRLEALGYTLRTGDAVGADKAFRTAVENKVVYTPKDCEQWCLDMVAKYVPSNRPPLEKMKPFVQRLLGRNMKQVLGDDGKSPSDFVVCWTLAETNNGGGTGYAMRCAEDHDIPLYNLRCGYQRALLFMHLDEVTPLPPQYLREVL